MSLRKEYRDLEMKVLRQLRDLVEASPNSKLNVNLFDYRYLTIENDRLVFVDHNGYSYSIFADADLEDLIEIIENN